MVKSGKIKTFDEIKRDFEEENNENSYEVARGRMIRSAHRMIALENIKKKSISVGFGVGTVAMFAGTFFGVAAGLPASIGDGGVSLLGVALGVLVFLAGKKAYYEIKKSEYETLQNSRIECC